ncbi:MAG: hypothetical protein K0S01_1427 [Herbinix sp.]|jgi:hypothetical protein|nr:hypothetical protein [Herbinix sp.]
MQNWFFGKIAIKKWRTSIRSSPPYKPKLETVVINCQPENNIINDNICKYNCQIFINHSIVKQYIIY